MKYIFAFIPLAMATPLAAQDIPFTPDATEMCLTKATDQAARTLCVGESAKACIDTPGGYTTVGMGFCYRAEATYWDERLNTAFGALMQVETTMLEEIRELGGTAPNAPGALRDMQRAWIGYRDATCAYEYTTWGGGTGGGPANASCLMQETGRQALILESRLADRSQ